MSVSFLLCTFMTYTCMASLASRIPVNAVLSAPWTPFGPGPTYALNTSVIPSYAASLASSGINVVWIAGGMGQFETLSVAERKQLAAAWVPAAKSHGLYTIVHVASNIQAEAIDLASHAASLGADAIASVPPYYEIETDPHVLAAWFQPTVLASGNLPFFYYHIPASTNVQIKMVDFLPVITAAIPSFAGVKYVSSDTMDYFSVIGAYGDSLALLWAPEPKLQAIPLGAQGVVLAESFYGPTWLRMCTAAKSQNWTAAHREQQWKITVDAIFTKYDPGNAGTNAKRALYKKTAGIDIGTNRPPSAGQPLTTAQFDAMIADLGSVGFFEQVVPDPCLLPKSW